MSAKQKRSSAKGTFTRSEKNFEKFIQDGDGDSSSLSVENYFHDVEKAWRNVEEKHEEYVASLDEDDDTDEDSWILEIQKRYFNIRSRYVQLKSDIELRVKFKSLEKCRNIEYETFLKFCANLETSVNDCLPRETITRERASLVRQFEEVKRKHSELCSFCPTDDEGSYKVWLNELIEQFSKVNSTSEAYLRKPIADVKGYETCKSVRMDKMPLPKFEGEVRFYYRFKRDFNELVLPGLKAREAAFALRQCLSGDIRNLLGSGDYDVEQMFKRLDEKFGDPSKMTDSIISEILKFKKIDDNDNKRVIEFINIIERAFHDMKSINMEGEINNTNVVSMIEHKLPKQLALNWYRFIHARDSKVDKANKFPYLLEYLINERSALEYGLSDLRILNDRGNATIHYVRSTSEFNCLVHNSDSHTTAECRSYNELPVREKYDLLKNKSACFSCLSPTHMMSDCSNKTKCGSCDKYHHTTLHPQLNREEVHAVMSPSEKYGATCIFPIMRVKVKGKNVDFANVLWDCCASICLITTAKANELGLRGLPSQITLTTVGGVENCLESKRFNVPLIDLRGRTFMVEAYSIEKISDDIKDVDYQKIKQFFPNVDIRELKRPRGNVDILIGYKYAAWHPTRDQSFEHLLILANSFGKCVGGSHPLIKEKTPRNESATFMVNLISSKNSLAELTAIENVGIEFAPKCGRCYCGNCPLGGKNCTLKEQREMELIEKNLKFSEDGFWIAGYPWTKDINNLPDNRCHALKMLIQTEKRLRREPSYGKRYCEQIQDMINRNVARKLSRTEMADYEGPIHYIAHHGVMKPSSKTTPIRIVFNASANFKGHVLNDYWAKGPNVFVNTLFGILIRFREDYVGYMGDISKMYNSVRIPERDQHCHRFLWRDMKLDVEPDTYVITRANMGDKPAGTISSTALRKTAEMELDTFPEAAKVIKNSSYMDDIIDCTDTIQSAHTLTTDLLNHLV